MLFQLFPLTKQRFCLTEGKPGAICRLRRRKIECFSKTVLTVGFSAHHDPVCITILSETDSDVSDS
jgi:hypothetical protein